MDVVIALVILGVGLLLYRVYKVKEARKKEEIDNLQDSQSVYGGFEKPVLTREIVKERLAAGRDRRAKIKEIAERLQDESDLPKEVESPTVLFSATVPAKEKERAPVPVCMDCSTQMIQGEATYCQIFMGRMVPVTQYLCPKCGNACRYLHTPNLNKDVEEASRHLCFWSHPDNKAAFDGRVADTFMPFKGYKVGRS